jgi:hypothetical protein
MTNLPQPQPKKKFKFEMWMLGALIVPVGITIAVMGVLKRNTVDIDGECTGDECKPGLECLSGTCMKSCFKAGDCPSGFTCGKINVTLKNAAGFHELGEQPYCVRAGAH